MTTPATSAVDAASLAAEGEGAALLWQVLEVYAVPLDHWPAAWPLGYAQYHSYLYIVIRIKYTTHIMHMVIGSSIPWEAVTWWPSSGQF